MTKEQPLEATEIVVAASHEVSGFNASPENVALLKTTLAGQSVNLTDNELQLFLYQVNRTKLDPLARQIYVMKSGGRLSFITSIDGYRLVAERSGKYLGQTKTEWEFNEQGKLLNATIGVIKKVGDDKDTTYATAWFDEYNKSTPIWNKMPKLMIAKVAESLALRKAFPQELANIYTEDEMDTTPHVSPTHPEEPSRDIKDDINPITNGTFEKLQNALRMKGITILSEQIAVLNALARNKGRANIRSLSEEQAQEVSRYISDPKTTTEILGKLKEA